MSYWLVLVISTHTFIIMNETLHRVEWLKIDVRYNLTTLAVSSQNKNLAEVTCLFVDLN